MATCRGRRFDPRGHRIEAPTDAQNKEAGAHLSVFTNGAFKERFCLEKVFAAKTILAVMFTLRLAANVQLTAHAQWP